MRDEYRVLTFFPEREAQGLETMLQEAADQGFSWVDLISRDRLVYIIMKREEHERHEPPAAVETRVPAKPTIGDSIIRAKPTLSQALVHTKH